jgi:hypothetical protein
MFDIEGGVWINAAGNLACGPTYLVGANGAVYGGFSDAAPSYADQRTQNLLSGAIR